MFILRWIIGLCLPSLLLGFLVVALLATEYRRPYLTVRIGQWLLSHNRERETVGTVWQGILASRRSRQLLDRPQADSLQVATLPKALLRSRFTLERASSEFLVMASRERRAPLSTRAIGRTQMQELATSLQYYRQGQILLSEVRLSRESFHTHAFVRAQIALEDGSIFPLLQRELQKISSPEAWNFVKMSPEDEHYWRGLLSSNFAPSLDLPAELGPDSQADVSRACAAVVESLTDSLYSAELDRLQRTWRFGGEMQIRLTRNMDEFVGYLVVENQAPVAVTVPGKKVTDVLGQGAPDWRRP